jgi:hypothetical protein
MTDLCGDDAVGYRRPPKATRWKKGESGNPKGRKRASFSAAATVDRMFAKQIHIVENGVKRSVSVLEAIVFRIWTMEIAGNKRAAALRLKFEELIPKPTEPPEIIIREIDET